MESRDLPWGGDDRAHWTPEQHRDWAEAEQELIEQGYRPRSTSIEVIATVPAAGVDLRWSWICTAAAFEFPSCHAVDNQLVAAELRLVDREVRGLDDDEDRAWVENLRQARGRLN